MNKFVNSVKNYLGDYAPLAINHKKYEVDVISQGADSGAALYDYCMQVIDQKFFGQAQIKILDLACGQGPFGVAAKKAGKSYIIDGIDIFVPEKDKLTAQGIYKQVIEADILKYDFGQFEGKYDLVVSNQFFEHLFPGESLNLLESIIASNTNLLISVPLPYQTFAYTKDYLLASLKGDKDFSGFLPVVLNSEVHKTYFTKKMMRFVGFSALPNPVFRSNFFLLG